MRIALLLAFALAFAACKRPGTDRGLQCERYADALLARRAECGGKVIDGTELTADNAIELAKRGKQKCDADQDLTPTADCLKELEAAPCDGDSPRRDAMPSCYAK